MQKRTLVERVIAFLKGGDEAKLSRFDSKLSKYLDKQILMRKESIETLREKVIDANESVNDFILQVDTQSLNHTDSIDRYVVTYIKEVSAKLVIVEGLEADIKVQEEEIARFEKMGRLIYPEAVN